MILKRNSITKHSRNWKVLAGLAGWFGVALVSDTPPGDPAPTFLRIELRNLFDIAAHQNQIPWKPFKDGVEIHRLYGDGIEGPTAALIRFRKAAQVPLHHHTGYEHIIVLSGSQRDQNGELSAGSLMINPPGTAHRVISEAGCIVLAIYERPVRFPEATPVK